MIYLDYSANTPVDARVLEQFCAVERRCIGNANSHHQAGSAAKAEIDAATITPAAKPASERCTKSPSARRIKNTHAAPSDVPIKGIRIPQKVSVNEVASFYGIYTKTQVLYTPCSVMLLTSCAHL